MTSFVRKIPRNAVLVVFLLALIVLSPSITDDGPAFLFEVVFDGILLGGVYSAGPGKHRWPFLALTAVTFGVRWAQHLSGHPALDVSALLITVLWLAYAVTIIVAHLFQRQEVTVDTILGAIVTYLLIAVAFTFIFEIIELRTPGSFSGVPHDAAHHRRELGASMVYFSLVCITTMGYGDIVPLSDIARPMAVLEGVVGQLYMAIMIARLVGLHIAGTRDD